MKWEVVRTKTAFVSDRFDSSWNQEEALNFIQHIINPLVIQVLGVGRLAACSISILFHLTAPISTTFNTSERKDVKDKSLDSV
jgi:hypothetical protein